MKRSRREIALALLALVAAAAVVASFALLLPDAPPNLYLLQAQAWLDGRLDLAAEGHDLAVIDGRRYVVFPPLPSLLLLPLVRVLGVEGTPVTAVAVALAALTGVALWRLLRRLDVSAGDARWLAAGFFLGTGLWLMVLWSRGIWYFAHVVATAFLVLAVCEALGRGSGWRVGLLAGLAFLARQLSLYALPFLLVALWRPDAEPRRRARAALGCLAAFGSALVAYLLFNYVRFGNPLETGYAAIPLSGHLAARVEAYGLFHPVYVPFNFLTLFVMGPHLEFAGPRYLLPLRFGELGTSLSVASPFLIAAFRARGERRLLAAAWLSVGLAVTHTLFYYNNGWYQLNTQRFSLDFLPVLFVLVALGIRNTSPALWKGLIVWSIALNVLALVVVPLAARWLA